MQTLQASEDVIMALAERLAVMAVKNPLFYDDYLAASRRARELECGGWRNYRSKPKMSQRARILKHLKEGKSITPLEALGVYGAYRLSAVIFDLRAAGYKIKTNLKNDGTGRQYAEYSLTS